MTIIFNYDILTSHHLQLETPITSSNHILVTITLPTKSVQKLIPKAVPKLEGNHHLVTLEVWKPQGILVNSSPVGVDDFQSAETRVGRILSPKTNQNTNRFSVQLVLFVDSPRVVTRETIKGPINKALSGWLSSIDALKHHEADAVEQVTYIIWTNWKLKRNYHSGTYKAMMGIARIDTPFFELATGVSFKNSITSTVHRSIFSGAPMLRWFGLSLGR